MYTYELDKDYTWEFSEPTILEVDGVRYDFLVCYDMYFYEAFANIARFDPDAPQEDLVDKALRSAE